jgi:uncharacterized protein (DUF488 family)
MCADRRRRKGVIGIGYEGHDVESFVAELNSEGVGIVVDVRLNPISRKQGFSKRALAGALDAAGIGYWHARALGNPKWNRAGFVGTSEESARAREKYAELLREDEARQWLDEISRAAATDVVALMCWEADQSHCHRDVVLSHLRESGSRTARTPRRTRTRATTR